MKKISGKMILGLLTLAGVGAYFYEKEKTASASTGVPPLAAPGAATANSAYVDPTTLPVNSEYQADTFSSAVALDQMLIASGAPSSSNATVTAFQQNVVLDPASASFAADHAPFIDGLYGPNTATALSMVLGTNSIVQPVIS